MENKNFSSKTMKHLKNETHHEAFKNMVKPLYKVIELDPLRIKVEMERKICFKRMFTMLVASLLFAPAIALSHCYFGFLIYILSIVLILYTIFIYYLKDGQGYDG